MPFNERRLTHRRRNILFYVLIAIHAFSNVPWVRLGNEPQLLFSCQSLQNFISAYLSSYSGISASLIGGRNEHV